MIALAAFAAVLALFGLVSQRLRGTLVTAPMVFTGAGLVLGWAVTNAVSQGGATPQAPAETARVIAEIALALLLFTQAAKLGIRRALASSRLAGRLLVIGMPLTILAGTLLAAGVVPGLPNLWTAAVLAVVLAPTDAALGAVIVEDRRVPAFLRRALNVESGLNDGMSVPFLTIFIEGALAVDQHRPLLHFAEVAVRLIGLGALIGTGVGVAGAWALQRASAAGWMQPVYRRFTFAAIALLCLTLADAAGGNGFIAAFVGGAAAGVILTRADLDTADTFAEAEGEIINLLVFFGFGVYAWTVLPEIGWREAGYALASLTVVRMLPVAIAVYRARLTRSEVLLAGWFGPRGLASIILLLLVVDELHGAPGLAEVTAVATATILLSVLLHGLTAAPLAAWIGRREPSAGDAPAPAAG